VSPATAGDDVAGDADREGLPSVPRRAVARVLDTVLVFTAGIVLQASLAEQVRTVVDGVPEDTWRTPPWVIVAVVLGGLAYEFGMLLWRGQTVGKLLLRIRVVDEATGGRPGVRSAAVRTGLTMGLLTVPLLGLVIALALQLTALLDPRLRGVHDRVAGTIVHRV
jgi:uncharacterized RDD family membrane protein YckC